MNNPLQELDHIHASQFTKDKTLVYVQNHHSHRHFHKSLLLIPLCISLVFLFMRTLSQPGQNAKPLAYVTLDINPSLELQLDQNYIVTETIAYNLEAQKILDQTKIQNQDIQSALLILLKNPQYTNYLTNGILEVTVFSNNKNISLQLETTLQNLLEDKLNINQYHCSQVNDDTHHKASLHHMSAGKYRIIETIISYTSQYSLKELNQYSIQKLYAILYTLNPDAVPHNCQPTYDEQNQHHSHKHL